MNMEDANLKVFGVAYDNRGKMAAWAIGIGRTVIGSVTKRARFFEATIGPVSRGGLTPKAAARAAWIAFCRWQPEAQEETPSQRVAVRSVKGTDRMEVYVGGRLAGFVTRMESGRYLAHVEDGEGSSDSPVSAARLAHIRATS